MTPSALPSEILLLSPRPDTDFAFDELRARVAPIFDPLPVRVFHVEGSGQTQPRPGAAVVASARHGTHAFLEAFAGDAGGWRWVHLCAGGSDSLAAWGPLPGNPLTTYSRGFNARSIAEWSIAAVLHFYRNFDLYQERAVGPPPRWERRWAQELTGARLLVVGAGAAGVETAVIARSFGMETTGVCRSQSHADAFDRIVAADQLDAELDTADVTLVLLPLTKETRGSIGAKRIQRLAQGSLLLVASRGGIVEEAAVLEAVRSGRLRGAAFDVFKDEPLPDDSPLWAEPRILVTPHVAGSTDRYMEHTARVLSEIWAAWQGAGDSAILDYYRYSRTDRA